MSGPSLKQKAVHGVAWYGGTRIVVQIVSWTITIIVARLVLPSDYGLLGMALVYVGFVDFINELGFGAAIVQRKDITPDDLDTLFWFGLANSVALYGVTLLVAPFVARFFNQPAVTRLLWVTGSMFLVNGVRMVPWNLLTRDVDFKRRSIAEVMGNFAGALVTVSLAYAGWGVWALAIGMLVPNAVMAVQVFAQTGWRPRLRFDIECLKRNLAFSLNVAGARVVWYMHDSSDRFVIGKFLGDSALGLYTVATRLGADLTGRFLQVINQVAFPVYSRLQDEPEQLKNYFLTSTQLICAVMFPVSIGLFLVADDLLPLLLGAKWASMIVPFKIVCWAAILKTIHAVAAPVVLAKGYSGLSFRFDLVCVAILPPSFWVATRWGLEGVCWVWLLVFPALVAYWLTRTRVIVGYRWEEFFRALWPAVASTSAMLAAVMAMKLTLLPHLQPLARVVLTVVLGAGVYLLCFVPLYPRPLKDIAGWFRPGGPVVAKTV